MSRQAPKDVDSVRKLVGRLQLVSPTPLLYNGEQLKEVPIAFFVSPAVLRYFECKVGCTACCLPFTLDFTPEEYFDETWGKDLDSRADRMFRSRTVRVNGRVKEIISYDQYKDDQCPFLAPIREGGALGCSFWSHGVGQPLECEAAPQLKMTSRKDISMLTSRPYTDGDKWKDPAQCIFHPVADHLAAIPDNAEAQCLERAETLRRYLHWAEYLEVKTYLPEAIEAVENLPAILRDNGVRSHQYA